MTTLLHITHVLSAAWAASGELITAGAILWALNAAANLIRITYKAGRLTGRILWPVIHATIAGLRWFHRNTDWSVVIPTVIECLVALVVAIWVGAQWAHRTLVSVSEQLGRCYAAAVTCQQNLMATPVPAMVHPLASVAADLESLTCAQLRAMLGTKRRLRKAELIAMVLA